MDQRLVLLEARDGVGVVTLNRPEAHNAVSEAMRAAFDEVMDAVAARDDIRVVLLRGEGRSFCSGRDTRELGHRGEGVSHEDYVGNAQRIRRKQYDLPVPCIAALRGHVIGAGAEMALAADIRIAASDLRFSVPEVRYGLALDTGGSGTLTALAGPARAKWLMMSGEPIGAEEALAWGLVEWVTSPEALDERAMRLALTLAARPPRAVAAQKALVDAIVSPGVREAMSRELAVQCELFEGEEYLTLKRARTPG